MRAEFGDSTTACKSYGVPGAVMNLNCEFESMVPGASTDAYGCAHLLVVEPSH